MRCALGYPKNLLNHSLNGSLEHVSGAKRHLGQINGNLMNHNAKKSKGEL